jgi:hypothetical protein
VELPASVPLCARARQIAWCRVVLVHQDSVIPPLVGVAVFLPFIHHRQMQVVQLLQAVLLLRQVAVSAVPETIAAEVRVVMWSAGEQSLAPWLAVAG